MSRNPSCTSCSLSSLPGRHICMWGIGNPQASLLIVGDAPDNKDYNQPFTDKEIRKLFESCGVTLQNSYWTYSVKCMPAYKGRKRRDITKQQVYACIDYLEEEAKNMPNLKITVLCGRTADQFGWKLERGKFLNHSIFKKVTKVFSPKFIFINKAYEELFINDFRNIFTLLATGHIEIREFGSGVIISDDDNEIQTLFNCAANRQYVASDVETNSLEYWGRNFQTTIYGACWGENEGVVFDPRRHVEAYAKFLQLPQAVHNSMFEGGIYPTQTRISYDTLIQGFLCNQFLPLKLEELANIYLGNIRWKGGEANWDDWARRNAIDVDVTWRLCELFKTRLTEKQKILHDEIVLPSALILADMQKRGVSVDYNYQRELEKILQREEKVIVQQLIDAGFPKEGNLNSPAQISNFLYQQLEVRIPEGALAEDSKNASSSAEFLAELALEYPICQTIREYRHIKKLQSNYIYDTNFIRPLYRICGTVTGRPSSDIGQTFPKESRVRKSIVSRRGMLASGDLRQVELVLLGARYAKDPTMIQIYRDDDDVHSITCKALGMELNKENRSKAKPCNFLLLYGGSWRRLRKTALKDYNINFSEFEAQRFSELWFRKYQGIKDYHNQVMRKILLGDTLAESPIGQRWNFGKPTKSNQDEIWRRWLNYPTQGVGAYLCLIGLIELVKLDREAPILIIHDQVVGDLPLGSDDLIQEWWRNWEKKINEFYFDEILVKVDMSAGPSLGELKEVEKRWKNKKL